MYSRVIVLIVVSLCACSSAPPREVAPQLPPDRYQRCREASRAHDEAALAAIRAEQLAEADIMIGVVALSPAATRNLLARDYDPAPTVAVRDDDAAGLATTFMAATVRSLTPGLEVSPARGVGLLSRATPDSPVPHLIEGRELEPSTNRQRMAERFGFAPATSGGFGGLDFLAVLATGGLVLTDGDYRAKLGRPRSDPPSAAEWRIVDTIGGWVMQRFEPMADGFEQHVITLPVSSRPFALQVSMRIALAGDGGSCELGPLDLTLPLDSRTTRLSVAIDAWFPHGPRDLRELTGAAASIDHDACAYGLACAQAGQCTTSTGGTCAATSERDCQHAEGCYQRGECFLVGGSCAVAPKRACGKGSACAGFGLCDKSREFAGDARCRATRADQCRAAEVCRERGWCDVREGRCAALHDDDCRASSDCRERGACTLVATRCAPDSPADCRASVVCRELGWCSPADGRCVATSGDDCTDSRLCRDFGWCVASYDACYRAPPDIVRRARWLSD